MQSALEDPKEVWISIPDRHRKMIRETNVRVFYTDMVKVAREVASEADLQMRMQGIVTLGAFLKLTPYAKQSGMSDDQVMAVTGLVIPHELDTPSQRLFETYGGFGRGFVRRWFRADTSRPVAPTWASAADDASSTHTSIHMNCVKRRLIGSFPL